VTVIPVPLDDVRDLLTRLLISKCLFRFDAETVAQRLLDADLRGLPEYGTASVPRILDALAAGDIDPRGRVLTLHETPAIAVLDGSRAVGAVAATKGMQVAIAKARQVGVGTVVVGNSQTLGAASVYSLLAAREGLIGFVTSSTGPATVAAHGAAQAAVGNHPVSWAVPLKGRAPFVTDFSCGSTSWSDVDAARARNEPLGAGIALDTDGLPTTDPHAAATLLPMAGARGFGMAFACSVLTGGLAGGKLPIRKKRSASAEDSQHFLQAFDPSAFIDPEHFAKELHSATEAIRSLPPAPGFDRVRLPGEDDDDRSAERIRTEGLLLDPALHAELGRLTPGGWTRSSAAPAPSCNG
jgi:LDH2 family malate/lactate/ureidoglycolate dehydrogenase